MISVPVPAIRAALEHLLTREGYEVRPPGAGASGLVLAGDADGLHVFETRDIAGALAQIRAGDGFSGSTLRGADGVYAFVPEPFGASDVSRVVRAVAGFDGRRRTFGRGGVGMADCEEDA